MDLAVRVDPALAVEEPAVTCAADSDPAGLSILCTQPDRPVAVDRAPAADRADWSLPSLVAVELYRAGGISAERLLRVEIDPYAPNGVRARACVVNESDGGADGPPACATSGELVLDRVPADVAGVAALHGTVHAAFPDFPLSLSCGDACWMRGLVLDARF
jgi:hypothetical protein